MRIFCTFVPQAWINHNAVRTDPAGPTSWVMEVDTLPKPHSHESDELRQSPLAPEWVRDHSGPYEVEYEVLEDDSLESRPCAVDRKTLNRR
jgi:hypothetical protein